MNSGVDFAAGGIVLLEQKILIVKNKRGDSPEDGIRDVERSRGLGDVYKRQPY